MFGDLQKGSPIYIVDKGSKPSYKVGEVDSINYPYNGFDTSASKGLVCTQVYLDIKVKVDDKIQEFNSVPSNYAVITYNNGKVIVSDSKQSLQQEVESNLQKSKNVIENIETIKQDVVEYEDVLKQLSPQFAKDTERDSKIAGLENRMNNVDAKLDKLIELVKSK